MQAVSNMFDCMFPDGRKTKRNNPTITEENYVLPFDTSNNKCDP